MLSTGQDDTRWDRENREARADFAKVDTYLCRTPAQLRRAAAEADEIALRSGYRRPDVPVHDFCGADLDHLDSRRFAPDNTIRIHGVPEVMDSGSAERSPDAWAAVFVWVGAVVLILLGFALGWIIGTLDTRAVLDLLSPTAVQAREAGWVSLSEGL